ncbi:MAG: N-6 DNA methylase [Sulfobacillus sp.]
MSDWTNYYTPDGVAKLITSLVDLEDPRSVIDICAGSGNLLRAAKGRWPNIDAVAVDVVEEVRVGDLPAGRHHIVDGRLFASRCAAEGVTFDLVLANPPFGYDKPSPGMIRGIRSLASLLQVPIRGFVLQRLEASLFIANICLVGPNGWLGIILPATMVESDVWRVFRSSISRRLQLRQVVKMPTTAFGRSRDISTYVLVFRRSEDPRPETLLAEAQLSADGWKLRTVGRRGRHDVTEGFWIPTQTEAAPAGDGYRIFRGRVTSKDFKTKDGIVPVLHVGNLVHKASTGTWGRVGKVGRESKSHQQAETGDILVVRVGKQAGLAVLFDDKEPIAISDCVLAVRCETDEVRDNSMRALTSSREGPMPSLTRGVAARFVAARTLAGLLHDHVAPCRGSG